jgi:hypothetical protein
MMIKSGELSATDPRML